MTTEQYTAEPEAWKYRYLVMDTGYKSDWQVTLAYDVISSLRRLYQEDLSIEIVPLYAAHSQQAQDYQEVLDSHAALVRELDGLLNNGVAAPQASLCDLVSQVRKQQPAPADMEQVRKERDELLAAVKNFRDVRGRHHTEIAANKLFDVMDAAIERAKREG